MSRKMNPTVATAPTKMVPAGAVTTAMTASLLMTLRRKTIQIAMSGPGSPMMMTMSPRRTRKRRRESKRRKTRRKRKRNTMMMMTMMTMIWLSLIKMRKTTFAASKRKRRNEPWMRTKIMIWRKNLRRRKSMLNREVMAGMKEPLILGLKSTPSLRKS